jgi:hypothetical protein
LPLGRFLAQRGSNFFLEEKFNKRSELVSEKKNLGKESAGKKNGLKFRNARKSEGRNSEKNNTRVVRKI